MQRLLNNEARSQDLRPAAGTEAISMEAMKHKHPSYLTLKQRAPAKNHDQKHEKGGKLKISPEVGTRIQGAKNPPRCPKLACNLHLTPHRVQPTARPPARNPPMSSTPDTGDALYSSEGG